MDNQHLVTKDDFIGHAKEDRENFQLIHAKLDKLVSDHPTNGELGLMISAVAKDVGEVKIQTTKTNGRVTALEATGHEDKGKGEGMRNLWGWVVAGVSVFIMIANFAIQNSK